MASFIANWRDEARIRDEEKTDKNAREKDRLKKLVDAVR